MRTEHKAYYQSPIGALEIAGSDDGISSILFVDQTGRDAPIPNCLKNCVEQLDEYFKGERKVFSIKFDLQGTDFQKKVWHELQKIPFGQTVSYLDIAKAIGDQNSTRAVGNANGKNKISIIIPCHRVIGSNGQLTGYGGGLWRKEWLINFESRVMQETLSK